MFSQKRKYLISFMWQSSERNTYSYANNVVTLLKNLDEKVVDDIRDSLAVKTQESENLSNKPSVCILNIISLGR